MTTVYQASVYLTGLAKTATVWIDQGVLRELEGETWVCRSGGMLEKLSPAWRECRQQACFDAAAKVDEFIAALTDQRDKLRRGET